MPWMSKDHIEELCCKYFVSEHERVRSEYLKYKARYIDTLDFVNDTILKIYEHAFFLHFTGVKVPMKRFVEGMNQRMFKTALCEIRERYVPVHSTSNREEKVVCNLYSICNS